MCDIDFGGEYATVWDERLVSKARKPHQCDTCLVEIAAGQSYLAHFSVFDGYPNHEKQCLRCLTIGNAFYREHHAGIAPGSLLDFLEGCLDEERYAVDEDDDDIDEDREVPRNQLPSRLSDEGLRWKYAMVEIRARRDAARVA